MAGYLARHEQPGETEARWTVTETGQRARQRSETGLTVRQARVLLLIPPHGITAQTLTRAYNALYGDHARELMYQSLAALQGLGVLQRSSSPAKWTLTVLGRTRIRDAAFRLTLDTPAPGPS
ncbi:hypothetical protein ACFOME_03510 [Deinococcus metalli]|uniref:hypothetical protein n=1 Tax=Deinococcus metalli TaxID=1141878 RepID=UPI00362344FC